ncbi:MAG: hypothetical protein MK077_08945 [Phycisphaerales bacterium]|nr:hypothetical protein [Phycisphaerales bacterium]
MVLPARLLQTAIGVEFDTIAADSINITTLRPAPAWVGLLATNLDEPQRAGHWLADV